MLNDSTIIILMNLDPRTRTKFLRNTYIPGLKQKLRIFAKKMVYTPQSIQNFNDLEPFINLMKYGGVPDQAILENLPKECENFFCGQNERCLCTQFIKMYFDCGFIYGPHLNPILNHADRMDFGLFYKVYKQVVKFGEENALLTMIDFTTGGDRTMIDFTTGGDRPVFRIEFLVHQIVDAKIDPKLIRNYLNFDFHHLKLDSYIIFEVLATGIEKDPDSYFPYFEEIIKIDFPKNDQNLNQSLNNFFGYLVQEAVNSRPHYRPLIESLKQFYPYMAKMMFTLYHDWNWFDQETQTWMTSMTNEMINNPKDLAFAFLLENYNF
jgi:hypothetical protein